MKKIRRGETELVLFSAYPQFLLGERMTDFHSPFPRDENWTDILSELNLYHLHLAISEQMKHALIVEWNWNPSNNSALSLELLIHSKARMRLCLLLNNSYQFLNFRKHLQIFYDLSVTTLTLTSSLLPIQEALSNDKVMFCSQHQDSDEILFQAQKIKAILAVVNIYLSQKLKLICPNCV